MTIITTYNESHLHAALKEWLAEPGDRFEQPVAGYTIDLVRGERLIEIQTANFGALRGKIGRLHPTHPLTIVHPVPSNTWIVKQDGENRPISRRKSPRHATLHHLFHQLVHLPELITLPGITLELLLVDVEEIRQQGRGRNWRRNGWGVCERRLLRVHSRHRFTSPHDYLALLPDNLPELFTSADLAATLPIPPALARRMLWCLRHAGLIVPAGKRQRTVLYRVGIGEQGLGSGAAVETSAGRENGEGVRSG
jgi:hypothetical protein